MSRMRSARHVPLLSAVLALAGMGASVGAQQAPPAPAQAAAPTQAQPAAPTPGVVTPTMIVVVSVQGSVQIARPSAAKPGQDDKPAAKTWEPARSGMMLPEGTEIRVPFVRGNSAIIAIGGTQRIEIDKGSVILRAAYNDAGVERTRLEIPASGGRLGIDVDSTRVANDVQVTTPEGTLAVKGTTFTIEYTQTYGMYTRGASGRVELQYANGARATVTANQESSSDTPDPATAQAQRSTVDTADTKSREADEYGLAQRSPGSGGESVAFSLGISPGGQSALTTSTEAQAKQLASAYYAYDQAQGRIIRQDVTLNRRDVVREQVLVDITAPFTGMAVGGSTAGERNLFLLRSGLEGSGDGVGARNRLYQLDLNRPTGPLSLLSDFASDNGRTLIQGLAFLGADLYGNGYDITSGPAGADSIYRLRTDAGMFEPVMSLPGVLTTGGFGGAGDRGSVFLAGRLNLADGSNGLVLLEMDPRTNYMVSTFGGRDADFLHVPNATNAASQQYTAIENITGLAYVGGVVYMSALARVGNDVQGIILQYDPAAKGTAESPRLRQIEPVAEGEFINALASEWTPVLRPSVALESVDGPIDTRTVNALFAQMSYGPEALTTDVLPRLVANEIVETSKDPRSCAASGALDALPAIMRRHVNRASGVGRTVAEFRDSLPPGHPCGARPR